MLARQWILALVTALCSQFAMGGFFAALLEEGTAFSKLFVTS